MPLASAVDGVDARLDLLIIFRTETAILADGFVLLLAASEPLSGQKRETANKVGKALNSQRSLAEAEPIGDRLNFRERPPSAGDAD